MNYKKGQGTLTALLVVAVIGLLVIGGFVAYGIVKPKEATIAGAGATGGAVTSGTAVVGAGCNQNPAYTYSAVDAFASTTVAGTTRIKQNNDKPVTALANPTVGLSLEYWISNASDVKCNIAKEASVQCGAKTMQTTCYFNASPTLAVVNTAGAGTALTNWFNTALAAGTAGNNLTLGASGLANLRFDFTGVAKHPVLPFGGCLVIERPSTIASVTLNGAGISSSASCKYPVTYNVNNTNNTYQSFDIPMGFDTAGLGDVKSVSMQLLNGATAVASGSIMEVVVIPANYYVTNAGNIVLGVEQDQNQLTTRTALEQDKFAVFFS